MSLKTENLQVWFGNQSILNCINLEFPNKNISAIMGPSGCGKTTLLKTLNRTLELEPGYRYTGRVMLSGKNIYAEKNVATVRRRIGLIFQTPVALPLSIKENVLFGVRYYGERNKAKLEEINEQCLKQAGLWKEVKDRLAQPARELSGGQIQRLSIARVLAVNPEILLLDEPCSNLDPSSTKMIEDLLHALANQLTIILVTHNLFQAKRVAHNTIFMMDGQIIESGETKRLFNHPEKQQTYDFISGLTW
ncbi:phosphate ABC transporter ATP-binding protein, PhoT family [Desulforamulus reducens MI-1]|uniref:Phosphate ABC transporter ATP-binding protein, PhoT family n=1 Tax=Desulforamulus reducens (strain ATCC BAA-1160 / DSM 100696 / MI-1) TaxID=349161 RepID=A4J6V5_DESRM|nr:phosphate ABC transporter ATP-binding protein [Desulforamulus reducens]ABO50808.1 phosphate ABC transporter ATP-binding protein, PhoT family [Desulforamulus reducens MI-1]